MKKKKPISAQRFLFTQALYQYLDESDFASDCAGYVEEQMKIMESQIYSQGYNDALDTMRTQTEKDRLAQAYVDDERRIMDENL